MLLMDVGFSVALLCLVICTGCVVISTYKMFFSRDNRW